MTRRPCKKGLRKGKPVGPSVVKIEIASIVNLYEEQRAMNMNSNLHPRTKFVKDLVKSLEMEKADRKRKDFVDRGIGTLQDGYKTVEEFERVMSYFFRIEGGDGLYLRQHDAHRN